MSSHLRRLGLIAAVCAGTTSLVVAQAGSDQLLVTPQQLVRELKDPHLVLLQVGPKEDYDAGHIVGARFIQLQDVAAPRSAGSPSLELPDENELRQRLERLGISDNSRIVVIPGADWGSPATRVVWTLQTAGLGSRTRLLDGGSGGWRRAGLPLTKEAPPPPAAGRLSLRADRSIVVDHSWVQSHLKSPRTRIIDGRAPMFYEGAGMPEHGHTAGRIPGAKNIPFSTLMDDSMRVLPRDELRRIFTTAGVQQGDTVVAYCHIGQQATVVLFIARLLGHPIKLYDGSFTDWESRKLPVEKTTPDSASSRK